MRALYKWIRIACGVLSLVSQGWAASKVTAIDFKGTTDPSEITIQSDGPVTFQKLENTQDNQVILELQGAQISKANSRNIDTSSFNSKVSLISPYQVVGQPDTVRVVVQLRGPGSADAIQEGNLIRIKVSNSASSVSSSDSPIAASLGAAPAPNSTENILPSVPAIPNTPTTDPVPVTPSVNNPQEPNTITLQNGQKTHLDEFLDGKKVQKFTGKPVTMQVRDAEVSDILRLIGEASGFNVVVGDDVRGKLSLSLVDVPWDQALDVILHTLHLGAERSNNILRVVTLQNLTTEKQDEYRAKKAAEDNAPRLTRVFPISYANLTDLQGVLTKFASSNSTSGGLAALPGTTPLVEVDRRTNSIIVRDTGDNIDKMKKLIELLDTQTPQVLIEAKVIEATESFSKSISGSLGIGSQGSTSFVSSFAGGNPIDPLVGSPGVFANGTAVGTASNPTGAPNGTFGVNPSLSFLPGQIRLNALLSWGESESQVKVVSSPRTVVLNKETANIVEGTPVLVPGTTTVAGVGSVPTTTVQQANLSLNVTPTVTNDGSVLMNLTVAKDVPQSLGNGNQGIANRNMTTLVLVESGSTLVIGGIYTMRSQHTGSGFPYLRKIPLIGALFGNESDDTDRTELFFFITPRILNQKEAGLNG